MQRIFSLALALILAALLLTKGYAYAGVGLLVLAAAFVISLVCAFASRKKVEARLATASATRAGKAECRFTVVNGSRLPLLNCGAILLLTNTLTGESTRKRVRLTVPAHGENTVTFTAAAARAGKISVSMPKLYLTDLFGLIPVRVNGEAHCNFTVVPDFFDTAVEYDLRESASFDNEVYSPYRKGQDRSEVFQIRDYEDGDPLGQIHWKLSGKLDKLIVKDPSLPLDRALVVALDKSCSREQSPETAERLAEIVVSVCQGLAAEAMSYQLLWNDVAQEQVFRREIQFEEEFQSAVPELLTGRVLPHPESLATLYARLYGSLEATHVIYVAAEPREIPDGVFGDARINVLTADQDDYRERYARIGLY